jgi:hypothetical protein
MFMISSYYSRSIELLYFFIDAVGLVTGIGIVGGFACYILSTRKVAYVLKFGEGTALHITVYGQGQVESSKQDYGSLKSAILRGAPPPPAPW